MFFPRVKPWVADYKNTVSVSVLISYKYFSDLDGISDVGSSILIMYVKG